MCLGGFGHIPGREVQQIMRQLIRAPDVQHSWLETIWSVEYWSMLVAGSHCAHTCKK